MASAAAEQEAVSPAEVRRRMRAWADTLETVIGALSRSKAPADVVTSIRVPVLDAIEKARGRVLAQRNAAKKKAPAAEDSAAGAAPPKS